MVAQVIPIIYPDRKSAGREHSDDCGIHEISDMEGLTGCSVQLPTHS